MNERIAIHATHRHPRLRYIARVLSQWWSVKVVLHTKESPECPVISYGIKSKGVYIEPHPFMSGKGPPNMARLRPDTAFSDFDPLSAIFWHLSRYEEYQPYTPDMHGRFSASSSLAWQLDLLDQPVAVLWADRLYNRLREKYPRLPALDRPFEYIPTYDVDMAWAFRARGWRGLARSGADLLQGKLKRLQARFASWLDRSKDPFYTFHQLREWHSTLNLKPHYFFLLAENRSQYDSNASPTFAPLQELIRYLDGLPQHSIGIHPSYFSMMDEGLAIKETEVLKQIIGRTPTGSRQHFLRLRLPDTYRALIRAGLRADYSMGYADAHGWRAGAHLPFPWYDLEREEATYFQIHPFPFMDVTLKNYQGLSPGEALQTMMFYRRQVEKLGGPLYSLWHNSSFSSVHGWEAYSAIYKRFLFNEE
ncbi:MAG: polysaccharide deacetylase family protein [Bacteroidota bacterium]